MTTATRTRLQGTVRWFNPEKGYGFIGPDAGGADVFVHITAVQEAGWNTLLENQRIEYELKPSPKAQKPAAVALRVPLEDRS